MAALFMLFLLLASGGAVDDNGGASLPHLQLPGITDSGREHASDAPPLMDIMSMNGCRSFAGLLAATPNASETFEQHIVSGGLTVFCPDDLAVEAFEPKFSKLSAANKLAALLNHGVASRYGREHLAASEWVAVRTLATDPATNKSLALTVGDDGDTVRLWPSPPSSGGSYVVPARVTKPIQSDDSPVAVYVVDTVLLPSHLRQLQDGGGYLGSLQVQGSAFRFTKKCRPSQGFENFRRDFDEILNTGLLHLTLPVWMVQLLIVNNYLCRLLVPWLTNWALMP